MIFYTVNMNIIVQTKFIIEGLDSSFQVYSLFLVAIRVIRMPLNV